MTHTILENWKSEEHWFNSPQVLEIYQCPDLGHPISH